MGGFLSEKDRELAAFIDAYRSFMVVPATSLDSLLATGILVKTLINHGWDAKVTLDPKVVIDYPKDPAILINLPGVNKQKHVTVESSPEKGSSAAKIVSVLDSMFGVDKWSKILAIVSGYYRNYYDFERGEFRGVENSILSELVQSKLVSEVPALKLWGAKRKNLVSALTRTLLPILPGFTGMPDQALRTVQNVFRVQDPLTIKYKEIRGDDERGMELLKAIANTVKDPSILKLILGDFYINASLLEVQGQSEIELSEVAGSLAVYRSLCRKCPYDVVLVPFSSHRISQIISVYDDVADDVAETIAAQFSSAKLGTPVSTEGVFERPDIVVDVLSYIASLPKDKPITVLLDQKPYTILSELLRTGVKPEKAYSSCEPDQLCVLQS